MNSKVLRVLVIDAEVPRAEAVCTALRGQGYAIAACCTVLDEMHQVLCQSDADIILIDMDSPGRDILEGMRWLSVHNPKPIALFTAENSQDSIAAAMSAGVSAYVVDGLQPPRVASVLAVALARFTEHQKLRQEVEVLKARLEERKDIEKAKGMLMKFKGIDEDQAYKELRKMAMDRQQSLGEVARYVHKLLAQLDKDV